MLVKVTKDTVKIVDEDYVLNKGEYHVNKCYFQFSDEYTDDLVKKAIFVNKNVKKEMVIANDECNIPYEVLVDNSFELRVYAYEADGEDLILRYSPTYTMAYLREGSYVSGATAGEEITPTQFEQYQQALNDGLAEVNEKLTDVDIAIIEANNLDAEVTKTANVSTLSLTKKDGTIQSVNILDGARGEPGSSGRDGRDGTDGITPTIGDNGNWYLGETDTGKPSRGATGPAGQDGQNGTDGTDGYSPTVATSKSGKVTTITITDKNGEHTATINDGNDGSNGTNGVGVPTGGTEGQVLAKASGTDYDTEWVNASSGDLSNYYTKDEVDNLIPTVPTNVSAFTNDAGYLTQHQDISGKLDTNKVKNSNSTTAGDVYDVRYINTMLGDIESLLNGI